MPLNLKISEKGLLLIFVPVVFESIFVCVLLFLLNQADRIALAESNKRTISAEMHKISSIFYEQFGLMMAYNASSDKELLRKSEALDYDIENCLSLLRDVALSENFSKVNLDELSRSTEALLKQVRLCRRRAEAHETDSFKSLRSLYDLKKSLSDLLDIFGGISNELGKNNSKSSQDLIRARGLVYACVILALIINITLAVYLAFYFSRNFSKRVQIIISDTKSIAGGEPLSEPLSGNDELAEIDRFIHLTARKLRAVEAERSEILSMVSHDIRSPLTAVKLLVAVALEGIYGQLDKRVYKALSQVDQMIASVVRLADDLLDVQAAGEGALRMRMETVDYAEVCMRSYKVMLPLVENAGLKLERNLEECFGYADSERIGQVLNNLISNAVKFSPANSTICMSLSTDADNVLISIRDSGSGVPESEREAIFDKHYQTETGLKKKRSAGLGLHICRTIVELHKGKIFVKEAAGGGAEFVIQLPTPADIDNETIV
ncbi:MAG: HAMP domain-containing histidine kinase [Candidatus Obscuribacterales bacterium]|nr:HAMP domain-containing histidine kinase [Candidatus Obscuribacterales bacterium]